MSNDPVDGDALARWIMANDARYPRVEDNLNDPVYAGPLVQSLARRAFAVYNARCREKREWDDLRYDQILWLIVGVEIERQMEWARRRCVTGEMADRDMYDSDRSIKLEIAPDDWTTQEAR